MADPLTLALIAGGSRLASTALGSALAPDPPGQAPSIGGFPGQGSGIDSQLMQLRGQMQQQASMQQQLRQQMLAQLIQSIMAQGQQSFSQPQQPQGQQQEQSGEFQGEVTPLPPHVQPSSKFGETPGGLLQQLMQLLGR